MKVVFDSEYEDLENSIIRESDIHKFCLFIDASGSNSKEAIYDLHWHEWIEITYIIEGSMTVETTLGVFEVNPNEVMVIGSRALHKIIGAKGAYRYQCFHVNIGFVTQFMNPNYIVNQVVKIKDNESILMNLQNIIKYMKHDDIVSSLRYKSNLLNLIASCIENIGYYDSYYEHDIFENILFYIGQHYQQQLQLYDVATYFHYTTQHVSFMFKKNMSTTFLSYLTRLRLDKANLLLKTTNKTIIEIALESGFSSERSFIMQFKKEYGTTPAKYRKIKKE